MTFSIIIATLIVLWSHLPSIWGHSISGSIRLICDLISPGSGLLRYGLPTVMRDRQQVGVEDGGWRGSAGIDCRAVSLRPPEPSCGRLADASVFGTWSTLRVVRFDITNVIRGPHRAVGSSPPRVESLRLRTHSWSMLGEIHLDPSPQPDKNG
jgi:hypothetical protein